MEMKKTKHKPVQLAETFNRLVNEYQWEPPSKLKEYEFEYSEPQQFELDLWEISDELTNLLIRKHADYGPKNISQSPGGPLNGLRVRMWDKIARINHLLDTGNDAKNESLEDSFADLANYSIIALMVLKGKWPTE
jgi:hypothetical protein